VDPDVRIRAATIDDLEPVRALLGGAALPIDGLEDHFGDPYCVAEVERRIVGAEGIEVHGADGLLRSAVIAPPWRGRGLGDALTRDRIRWARGRGLRALYLLTTTAADYFPRFGFTIADRAAAPAAIRASREFAVACPDTAAFMQLSLGTDD
jgi:amino-acid N-acetyltransferase